MKTRWLLVAVAALVVGGPAVTTVATQSAGYAWRFEVIQPFSTASCVPSVLLDDLKIDPTGRQVVAWRESGCDIPYTPEEQGFKWARRAARSPSWTINSIINQTCGFLGCRGLRGDPPALAMRPDGTPFYLYGREGQFEWFRVATINLDENPTGVNPDLGEWLAQYQGSDSWPRLSAAFPATGSQALPNYVRGSGSAVTLNGAPHFTAAANPLRYVNGPDGQDHIVFYGNNGEGWRYYYANGTPDGASPIPILGPAETTGLSAVADSSNAVHVALTGVSDDINWFWSTLLYVRRDSSGVWSQEVIVDGHTTSNRNPSIALDADGDPAIAYWRYPDQIRLARFDGAAWSDSLITRTGSVLNQVSKPQLAFDLQNRPVVAFYHEGTNTLMTATGSAGVPASFLVSLYGAGSGAVSSLPAGLACPGVCASTVPDGSIVALLPTPASDSVFVGWTGACSGSGACVVAAGGLQSVGARFELAPARHHIALTTASQFGSGSECTLGDAIRAANTDTAINGCAAGSGPDTIDLAAATYTLTGIGQDGYQGPNGLPAIYTDIEIRGAGAASTIIERSPTAPEFRILDVTYYPAGARLSLSGVTIRGGVGVGGALIVNGATQITDAVIEGNAATAREYGGAIRVWTSAPVTLNRTTFRNNYAFSGGGAIFANGPLEIRDSFFDANQSSWTGGALLVSGTTTIINTGMAHSQTRFSGGAIDNSGSLTIIGSTFDANAVTEGGGGAIASGGPLTLIDSRLTVNHAPNGTGGALTTGAVSSIVRSTLVGNDARHGGAIDNSSTLTITNSTISGNRAEGIAGGIYNRGPLTLRSATIVFNVGLPGWGSGVMSTSAVQMQNSVIANNMTTPGEIDCYTETGGFQSHGYNFVAGDYNCLSAPSDGDRSASYLAPLDARIATALSNGTTWTHALLPGSPLINAGNPAAPDSSPAACPAVDQRGVTRPQRGVCDIGAFEKTDETPVAIDQSLTTAEDAAIDITLTGRDADGDPVAFVVLSAPAHGTITGTPPAIRYTPNADFHGSDAFTVAGSNAYAAGAAATIAIDVTPMNDPPTAVADTAAVIENGGAQSIDVLGNDSDAPDTGETLSVIRVTNGLSGAVAVGTGSDVVYTPAIGFAGDDTFTYTIADGNGGEATATVAVTVRPSADLEVKVTSPATAAAGNPFDYTITVINHGPAVATDVHVFDTLSPNLIVLSSDCARMGFVADCHVSGPISPGTSREFKIKVASPDYGYLPNSAEVRGAEPDPNPSNNTKSIATVISAGSDVLLELTQSSDPTRAFETLTYYVRVFNRSGGTAANVVVDDTLPSGVTFLRASPGCEWLGALVLCAQSELPLNHEVMFWIEVQPTRVGTIVNHASVTASGTDTDPDNNQRSISTTVLAGRADLSASISAAPQESSHLVLTASATNHGPSPATDVHLLIAMPAGLEYVGGTATQGSCVYAAATRLLDCALGELARQGSGTVTAVASHQDSSPAFLVTAIAAAAEEDPQPLNNQDTTKAADLRITLSAPSGPLPEGQPLVVTATVTNAGPNAAENVYLHFGRSTGILFADPCDIGVFEANCGLGTLPAGSATSFAFHVTWLLPARLLGGDYDGVAFDQEWVISVSAATPLMSSSQTRAVASTQIYAAADLSLASATVVDTLAAGDPVVYSLTVTNLTDRHTDGVKIEHTVAAGSILRNAAGRDWTCPTPAANTVTCTYGRDVRKGDTPPLYVSTTPAPAGGAVTATSRATSSLVDPFETNNVVATSLTATVHTVVAKRAMVILVEVDNLADAESVDQLPRNAAALVYKDARFAIAGVNEVIDRILGANLPEVPELLEQALRNAVNSMSADGARAIKTDFAGAPQCFIDMLDREIISGIADTQTDDSDVADCLGQMARPYYDRVEVLTGAGGSFARFSAVLGELHDAGYTIDLLIDVHGCGGPSTMNEEPCGDPALQFANEEMVRERQLRDLNHGHVRLGSVYMTSCWGSSLNQMWIDLGARESNASREINFYGHLSPFAFLDAFTRQGFSLERAAQIGYDQDHRLMAGTDFNLAIDLRFVPFCSNCFGVVPIGALYEASRDAEAGKKYGEDRSKPLVMANVSRRVHQASATVFAAGSVNLPDDGAPTASIVFASVTEPLRASVRVSDFGPAVPMGFQLGQPAMFYELATSVTFSGTADVCINYDPRRFENEATIQLLHYEEGQWRNHTTTLNLSTHTVCASVTSFSPFAVVEPTPANTAPVVVFPGDQLSMEGQFASVTIIASDAQHDRLTFTGVGLPPGLQLSTNGVVTGVPTDRAAGVYHVVVEVSDGRASAVTAFDWTIIDMSGRMRGHGHVEQSSLEHHFEFTVTERRNGADHGRVKFWIREADRPKKNGKEKSRFDAGVITAVTFSNDQGFKPGKKARPTIDSVSFSGTGRWNGKAGYTFEARATDEGEPGIGRDTFVITIRDAKNVVVASVSGKLAAGNVQSLRLPGRD